AGTYTVSVYDANGCGPSTASITITEPTAIVASITLDSNVSCNGLSDGGATASATGGTGTYTYNWSNGPTTASNQGIAAGTYTVSITDANGCGPSTASITITEPAPIIVNIVVDSNATCIGNMDGGATATASGGAIPYTYSWSNSDVTASISGVADGTYSVIVTDANGCSGVDTTDIIVVDTIKPTVVTIDTTIYLASSGLFTIDSSFVNNGSFDNCTVARIELDSTNFDCSELGSNTVQLIVTDINGNIDSAAATVTVRDTILPTINNCPADIIVSTDPSNCAAVVNWTAPTAADNCTVDSLVGNFTSGSTFPIGTTTVRYIAYDQGLLTDTCFFTITVVDNEEPVITNVPANINVNNEADSCSALATWTPPTAADNCTLDSLVSNITPGSRFPVGITSIEYIAYDNALNTDTISFTVTVNDIEPPTISCPADTTICAPIFTFSIPNGADNCAVLSVVQIEGIPSGGNYPVGATANKFLITDVNGNVDSCSFIVTRIAEPTVANAGNDSTICSDSIRLSANVPVIGNGSWSSPDAAIIFDDGTDPTSQARNLSRGLNSIVWTISNGICNVSRDTVEITFENDPSPSMAGPDQLLCEQFQTNLAANTPAIGNGIWTILSGSGNLSSNTSPTASLSGLSPGSTQLSWTITNAVCQPSIDSVTVVVSNNPTADAGPDQKIFTSDGTTLTVSSDSSGSPLTRYQWQPSNLLDDPMSASTSSNDNLNSSTEFIVVVTSSIGCEGRDTVFVEVNGSFTLPTAFTPNNDGYNDTWEIKNLESDLISSHRIAVFNNSGSEIFSSTNYQPWDGRFNGEDLPVGSYYFVLELERTDGEKEVKTGVVSILK
ncbi:MAG: HYR domain-containing protein, partial [Vicingaceae bacterium]